MKLNKLIDHAFLKATTTPTEIKTLCKKAVEYDLYSVCANSCYVAAIKKFLAGADIKVCSAVGFPSGVVLAKAKYFETSEATVDGADEIDVVLNVSRPELGEAQKVLEDMTALKQCVGENRVLKVILEAYYPTDEEKRLVCKLALRTYTDFVKTSTGFGTGRATLAGVKLMKEYTQGKAKVKTSGGIRDYETAMQCVALGVECIGTSNGTVILKGEKGTGY